MITPTKPGWYRVRLKPRDADEDTPLHSDEWVHVLWQPDSEWPVQIPGNGFYAEWVTEWGEPIDDIIAERDSLRAEVAAAQLARDTYHARLTNIVDEAFGMQPTMSGEALMTFLESRLFVARAESDQSEARIRAEERVLVEHEIANWMRGRSSMDDVYIDENELSTIADAIEASDYREDET